MTASLTAELKGRMEKALENLVSEFGKLRTGRASVALLDGVRVECYGTQMPLNQVGTLSVSDNRTIVISPWDKGVIGEIEKAIQKSELGIQPTNDGKVVRVSLPPLTEERRRELAKVAKKLTEECRVSVRNVRREGNESCRTLLKEKTVSEDEVKKQEMEIQKMTDEAISRADSLLERKEKEILEI